MKNYLRFLTFLLSFYCNFTSAQVTQVWVARYNGPANSSDWGTDVTFDAAGNVYVTGSSFNSSATDYATLKYNSNGIQQWAARYNGPANGYDNPSTIAIDASGNVYVTGQSQRNDGAFQMTTIKYNSSGVQQWVQRYDSTSGTYDYGKFLALDAFGNIYVAGSASDGFYSDLTIIKYSPAGSVLWVSRYRGTGCHAAEANWITLDGAGNVYATGSSILDSSAYNQYLTVKYNSDGILQWARTYIQFAQAAGLSLALDQFGNVVVTGSSTYYRSGDDYATIRYSPSGIQRWVTRYNGYGSSSENAWSVAIDANSNIYVNGISTAPLFQYALVKYDSLGAEQWVRRYSLINGGFAPPQMVLGRDGNVYVCGYKNAGASGADYLTAKFDPCGNQLWEMLYNGPGNDLDGARAIAVDSSGNVYVTGASAPNPLTYDFATIKYSQLVGINPVTNEIPASFQLYQNYPNPFNPSTRIQFDIPPSKGDRGMIRLVIYDILGREVATLVNEQLKPGTYEVEWDASNYPSGVYYYKLSAGDFTETKKMVVLK